MNREQAYDALRAAEQGGEGVVVKVTGPGSLSDPATASQALVYNDGEGQREYWIGDKCIGWIESGREIIDTWGNVRTEWRFTPCDTRHDRAPVRANFSTAREDLREYLYANRYGPVSFEPAEGRPR